MGTFLLVPDEVRQTRETLTLPAKQAEALAILCRADEPLTVADVCRLAKCATGPIAALRQRGHIHTVRRRIPQAPPAAPDVDREEEATPARPELTAEQEAVMARLAPALEADAFATVPAPRRHRQRQDRGLPAGHRAGRRAGAGRRSSWCPRSA